MIKSSILQYAQVLLFPKSRQEQVDRQGLNKLLIIPSILTLKYFVKILIQKKQITSHILYSIYNYTLTILCIMEYQRMNEGESEKILAVFLERNQIGVCYFNFNSVRVQCSSISHTCMPAYRNLIPLINSSTTLLLNHTQHELFTFLDIDQIKNIVINDKSLENDIIEHHLTKISAHMSSLKNPKPYFQKMKEDKYKFKALGMFLYHYFNHSHEWSDRYKIYLDEIEYFNDTLFQFVQYSRSELQFLEITREDIHPSLIKGKGHSKEGYSILSAYEAYMLSTGSKKILRYLFMNPTYKIETLQERLDLIQWMKFYMRDGNKYNKYFRSIHVLDTILKKFGMSAEEEDWKKLMRTLEAMLELRKLICYENMPKEVSVFVQSQNWDDISELFHIFKETIEFNPFCIKNGVDANLDRLKQTYDNMPHMLTLIAKEQNWQLQFRIVFMTQVGYLIKINIETQFPEGFDTEEWILQISNNSGKYYANELTQALDNKYGDIFGQIQDMQNKLVLEMQNLVIQRSQTILKLYWQICEIQCFWGITQISRNMARPKLSSQALIISNGWHLLLTGNIIHNHAFSFGQGQAPKQQVMNSEKNIVNMNYSNRCMIITGPNASGKTIYMKQLGIIIYLAHLGFFVPANLAEIPLIDCILFVGKASSIYKGGQCGFYSQLKSLSSICLPNIISNKSLILIDELGAEIDYENSLRLLNTTIQFLTSQNSAFYKNTLLTKHKDEFNTPLVLMVTHLLEVLHSKIVEENYLIRFLQMSVEQKVRLFKIKPGLVAKGYGIQSATQIMPTSFINLSKKYYELINQE